MEFDEKNAINSNEDKLSCCIDENVVSEKPADQAEHSEVECPYLCVDEVACNEDGEQAPETSNKSRKIIIAVVACISLVIGVLFGTHIICINHNWQPATCLDPEVCSKCHRTQGEALGHDWMNATCTEPETCSACSETQGVALGHMWLEATCTAPETCIVCSETQGVALGHEWFEATCTIPETCLVCGETQGVAPGHKWLEATCTKPETCSVCSETQGYPLDHVEGDWVTITEATLNKSGTATKSCTACGEIIDTKIVTKSLAVGSSRFNFKSEELLTYMDNHINSDYSILSVGSELEGAENCTAYPVYKNGSFVAFILLKTDSSGYVIMIAPTSEETAVSQALAIFFAEKIASSFDPDAALYSLAMLGSYTAGGMDIVSGAIGDYTMTIISPEGLTD